jgi:hypothetical protein
MQHPLLKKLGDMEGFAASALLDHFPTAESVGENERVTKGFANCGK